MDFTSYHSFSTMYKYIHCIRMRHPEQARLLEIGQSVEGRPLNVVHLPRLNQAGENRAIWIDAGMHAREWITAPVALYLLYQLVEESQNEMSRSIRQNYDIYILPMVNPDG